VQAPAAEASVVVVGPIPDTAASAKVPVRVATIILGIRWYRRVMSLL
jgi:hypothetical protein